MWILLGPGIKLVSPTMQGGFLITGPPGKQGSPPLPLLVGYRRFSGGFGGPGGSEMLDEKIPLLE